MRPAAVDELRGGAAAGKRGRRRARRVTVGKNADRGGSLRGLRGQRGLRVLLEAVRGPLSIRVPTAPHTQYCIKVAPGKSMCYPSIHRRLIKRSDVLWKISRLSVFENVLFIILGKVPLKIQ